MREARVALAGCGRLAERGYLPAFDRANAVRLVAVADPVSERRKSASVPGFGRVEELLARVETDALVVATPPAAHLATAALAADAGLASVVEKPPALTAPEAASLAALRPAPWIGFNRRFEPRLHELRRRLRTDAPTRLELVLAADGAGWSSYESRGVDALADLGSHLVDLGSWLSGRRVVRVRAGSLTPEEARFELDLDGVPCAVACAASGAYRELVDATLASGERVRVTLSGRARAAGRRLRGRPTLLVHLLTRQLEALARALGGDDAAPLATAADGLAAMAALDAVRRSASAGGAWVEIG